MRALVLFAALLIAGCAQTATTPATTLAAKPQMPADITSEAACVAAGGSWGPVGLMGTPACTQSSPTTGKQCTDSSECAGSCWSDQAPGSKATGSCQPTNMPFGCHSEVVNGVVQPALCAD